MVDFVRSCYRGKWRLFPGRPDVITSGFLYFAKKDTPAINAPHPWGAGGWNKDGNLYPVTAVGPAMDLGTEWYNGQPPDELPPDTQVGSDGDIQSDFNFPVNPPVELRNAFDSRCFVVGHPGVEIPVEDFLKPDIVSPCWWRVLAGLLQTLTLPDAGILSPWDRASFELWPAPFSRTVHTLTSNVNRFAWVEGPDFQIILRVGTQTWSELWTQIWHGTGPPRDYGTWGTERVWFDEATAMVEYLNANGFDADKPLTLVGHSKGAAVLWVLARRMTDSFPAREVRVLTFGTPKVGDLRMRELDNIDAAVHVIHAQDVVPLIPPNPPTMPLIRFLLTDAQIRGLSAWTNYRSYSVIGDGNITNRPADELPWQTYAEWIRQLFRGQTPEPIQQHFVSGYVSALRATCCKPEFPFTDRLYDILFGGHVCEEMGLAQGGAGELGQVDAGGGAKVGGAGAVNVSADGGVELGGAGVELLADEAGGVELGGAGVMAYTPGFGASCTTAGVLTLGTVYTYNTPANLNGWLAMPDTGSTAYTVHIVVIAGTIGTVQVSDQSCASPVPHALIGPPGGTSSFTSVAGGGQVMLFVNTPSVNNWTQITVQITSP